MKGPIGLFHPYGVWMIFHSHDPREIPSHLYFTLLSWHIWAGKTQAFETQDPHCLLAPLFSHFLDIGNGTEACNGYSRIFNLYTACSGRSLMKKSVSIHLFLLCSSICLESCNTLSWIVLGTLKKFCFC